MKRVQHDLTITEEGSDAEIRRLVLKGRINSESAELLQDKLREIVGAGCARIVLNLRQVTFLSSGGIRALLMYYKKCKELGGSFFLENPSENAKNVLGLASLDKMLLRPD